MDLQMNDVVDFTLNDQGSFTKGNFLRGIIKGFTLKEFVKIESPTYTKRSGLALACVNRKCVRPHTTTNNARREQEAQILRDAWLASMIKTKNHNKIKKSKRDYSRFHDLAK